MSEYLPTPKKSLKELEKEEIKRFKGELWIKYLNCVKIYQN